jgi:hypothetical protein
MSSTFLTEILEYVDEFKKSGSVTKGSILSNDGTGTFELVNPTVNGQVLESDSAESSGVKWAAITAVTSVGSGTGLTGGPITSTGTLSLADRGIVTVGSIMDADYATISAAYVDGKDNVRVITDVTETAQIDLSSGSKHLRVEINPGVSITNTIAAAADWFIGDDTLLTVVGAGAHLDLTTAGLSSRITLQSGQTFRSGTNAELQTDNVRYTGAGTNIFLGGSSQINNCRFDSATRFDFDLFEQYLHVRGCLFDAPVKVNSLTGSEEKTAIIIGNIFLGGAHITADGVDDMIFSGNKLGKSTTGTNFTISGTSCNSLLINDNIFDRGEVTISATTLDDSTISNNVFSRDTVDGMTISSTCDNISITGNVLDHITVNASITESVIDGNVMSDDLTVTGTMTSCKVLGNCVVDNLTLAVVVSSTITENSIGDVLTVGTSCTTSTFDGNKCDSAVLNLVTECTISNNVFSIDILDIVGNCINTTIIGNSIEGNLRITGNIDELMINGNRCANILIIGTCADCTINNNYVTSQINVTLAVDRTTFSGNVAAALDLESTVTVTTIGDNSLYQSGGNALTILGNCVRVMISGNSAFSSSSHAISGNFTDSVYSDNYVNGSVTFGGTITTSTISGNSIDTNLILSDVVTGLSVTVNTINRIELLSTATGVIISGNIFRQVGGSLIAITGVSTYVMVIGNSATNTNGAFLFSSNFRNGTVSNNVANGITFSGTVLETTISGNTFLNGITITGAITRCSLTGNLVSWFLLSSTATGVTFSGNITSTTSGSALSIAGNCSEVVISDNTSQNVGTYLLSGNFLNCTLTGNRIHGALTFGGTITTCAISDNIIDDGMSVTSAVATSSFSGNRAESFAFTTTISNVAIIGNHLTTSAAIHVIDVGGTSTDARISENTGSTLSNFGYSFAGNFSGGGLNGNEVGEILFGGSLTDATISNNEVTSDISVASVLTSCTIVGNKVDDDITVAGIVTSCTINGNKCDNITLNTNGLGVASINSTLSGNTCGTLISFGVATAGTTTDCVINGNYAPSGTTTENTGGGNIVTSNRNGGTVGSFGAGDTLANNL